MTLVYIWLSLNAGFLIGAWWTSRRWLRRIDELSQGILGAEWKRN